jgi:hypothetical protein
MQPIVIRETLSPLWPSLLYSMRAPPPRWLPLHLATRLEGRPGEVKGESRGSSRALEPCRDDLTRKDYDDLVPALAQVLGWEALIVLLDARGLSTGAARTLTLRRLKQSSTPASTPASRPPRAAAESGDRGQGHVTRASKPTHA